MDDQTFTTMETNMRELFTDELWENNCLPAELEYWE